MTVTVYAKPACPQCTATVRQLEKLKAEGADIDYRKIDVTTDPAAHEQCRQLGYSSAPVVVAGDQHWSGFRPDRLAKLVA